MNAPADLLRAGLWPLSLVYGLAVRLRNAAFDHGLREVHRLGVPVVSVGNLTVGGTGKTPLVVWLVERARALGRRPGVLARGYGRAPGAPLNDEGLLLEARFPGLPQVQDPDRVAGGRRLCREHEVDLLLLDDGFQHRRLGRDLDLVCADAARPFDRGMLLPAGDLREPATGLRRAGAVVMTRAGGLDPARIDRSIAALRRAAGRALPVFVSEHAPVDLLAAETGRVESPDALRGRRVHLLSAIARPAAFERSVAALGAEVRARHARRDHHVHDAAEVRALAAAARADGAELLVTEKDAVKLGAVDAPYLVLRIGLRFLRGEPSPAEVGLG
jgi:tetraacyldisaccharide 4'-kinase